MFEEGNLVIFTCHDTVQVGMITAVNRRTGTKKTYNIRSEKGFEYICVGVDDLLSSYTILKDISKQNLKSKKINIIITKIIYHTLNFIFIFFHV